MSQPKQPPQPQSQGQRPARAPVDEDVDDLDDLLEQFESAPAKAKAQPAALASSTTSANPNAASKSAAPGTTLGIDDLDLSDDFARELAEGMAALMREIAAEASTGEASASAPGAATASGGSAGGKRTDKDKDKGKGVSVGAGTGAEKGEGEESEGMTEEERRREEAFRRAWEEMVVEALDGEGLGPGAAAAKGTGAGSAAAGSTTATKAAGTAAGKTSAAGSAGTKAKVSEGEGEDAFQASIRKAMEKLRESESNLNTASPADEDAALEQLLRTLGASGAGGEGAGAGADDDQIQGLLENMMTQLMSKEVLYEPLKELSDKFPGFMTEKGASLKPEERTRFEGQQRVVREVVAIFEDPAYSTENAAQNVRVVTLMNEMQSYGAPPTEIMGPLPPGLELGQDGLPALPDGCTIA